MKLTLGRIIPCVNRIIIEETVSEGKWCWGLFRLKFGRRAGLLRVSSHINLPPPISPRRGNCKKASLGLVCEIGLRCRTYYVLCGSVLSVWTKVEGVLASVSGTNVKMQIVRLRTEDGQRIVGESIFYFWFELWGTNPVFIFHFVSFILDSWHLCLVVGYSLLYMFLRGRMEVKPLKGLRWFQPKPWVIFHFMLRLLPTPLARCHCLRRLAGSQCGDAAPPLAQMLCSLPFDVCWAGSRLELRATVHRGWAGVPQAAGAGPAHCLLSYRLHGGPSGDHTSPLLRLRCICNSLSRPCAADGQPVARASSWARFWPSRMFGGFTSSFELVTNI